LAVFFSGITNLLAPVQYHLLAPDAIPRALPSVSYSGSAIGYCRALFQPQSGIGRSGGRRPLDDRRVGTASALIESV